MRGPTVFLFDVDGTIVTTGGAGGRALRRALLACGFSDAERFSYAGMTDRAIVRRHLTETRVEATAERIDEVLTRYLELLEEEVQSTPAADYRMLRGIARAIDAAEARPTSAVGLGTGNVERGARIKLRRVEVSHRFSFGGFGSDAEDRAELIRVGADRGAAQLGVPRAECRIVVIGDTPRDVAAAQANAAECIAVATGRHTRDELAAAGATWAFDDFSADGALDALLDG